MKYRNTPDKFKIATIILSIVSIILLVACLFLLKFGLSLKDQLLLSVDAMSQVETQISQFQTGTVQMTEEYNKLVTELTTASTTIQSQKKEIELLQDTVDTYKEQINTLMNACGQRTTQSTQTTQQVPSSLSMPSLGINTNTSSALQQGNISTPSNSSSQSQNNSNFEVITID